MTFVACHTLFPVTHSDRINITDGGGSEIFTVLLCNLTHRSIPFKPSGNYGMWSVIVMDIQQAKSLPKRAQDSRRGGKDTE